MPVTPDPVAATQPGVEDPHPPRRRIRIWQIFLSIFIFEVGLVLVILPWRDTWYLNYFRQSLPVLEYMWDQDFFRGAISALGAVNLYIALVQFLSSFRK